MSRIVTSVWAQQPNPGEGEICKTCRFARPEDPRKTYRCALTKHHGGIYLPPHLHISREREVCSEHFPKGRPAAPVPETGVETPPCQ